MGAADVVDLIVRLPPAPRRTLFAAAHEAGVSAAAAERYLAGLEPADRSILVLVLGLGLDLGTVAFVLKLDPSVVAWRLRRALLGAPASGPQADTPAALEAGLTRWLRSPAPGAGASSGPKSATVAERFFAEFPAEVRELLVSRLDRDHQDELTAGRGPGLGIGSLVLILVAAAGFMVYGAVRDVNPLWRGMALVRQADYPAARSAFQQLGSHLEGRVWTAITWLSEGNYEQALAILAEPDTARFLGEFRPVEAAIASLGASSDSQALLPRGLISEPRPQFVYRAEGATTLTLELLVEPAGESRRVRRPLPDPGSANLVVLPYPDDWPELADQVVLWDVLDAGHEPTSFTVLSREARRNMTQHVAAKLKHDIPSPAREFLRAHFDLRSGLLVESGERFALLAEQFPEAEYPRRMMARVAEALGVDPEVLVR